MATTFGYTERCPACHARVPLGSYRCLCCKIYFCVRCGRQIRQGKDRGFYCQKSRCPCHNRLLCADCVARVEVHKGSRVLRWIGRGKDEWVNVCTACKTPAGKFVFGKEYWTQLK